MLRPEPLRAALLEARSPEGGWGYRTGRQPRVEPTSFALMALGGAHGPAPTSRDQGPAAASRDVGPGLDAPAVFARFERRDGLLIDPGATHPNIAFNGIAALAAHGSPGARGVAESLVTALMARRGVTLRDSKEIVQDNSLVGWPWLDGTFSWVEPTAWCLLALKRWGGTSPSSDLAARVAEAERLLRDRMCKGGGWNYGNRLVLDKALRPYASTTALGLLALQRTPDDPVVRVSKDALKRLCLREQSGYALALSCLAFARLGTPEPAVESALARLWDETAFGGEVVPTALALYVAEGRAGGYSAFSVTG